MRLLIKIATVLLLSSALLSPCLAGGVRTFGGGNDGPGRPFQGEVIFEGQGKGHKAFRFQTLIWCRDKEHYRLENIDSGFVARNYVIRDGSVLYMTMANPRKPENAKWTCCPVFWMGKDLLDTYLRREKRVRDAVLVGIESVQGIRAEHWRGRPAGKYAKADSKVDLWLSKDPSFPYVLKEKTARSGYSGAYEITDLKLQPVASYMLTSQVNPQPGLAAQLLTLYKPLWMILLWNALILLAYSWLVVAIMRGKGRWTRWLSVAGASAAILGLLCLAPQCDQFQNQLSGLPVLIMIGGMFAAAIYYWSKNFPIPDDVRLFAGTRWPVVIWAIIAVGVSLFLSTSRAQASASQNFGLVLQGLPFLPQTLATVIVYAATWAALEEVVFRGYIIGALKTRFSSLWLVNLLQAVVFALEHIPMLRRMPSSAPPMALGLFVIFIFGLIFGGLRLKYRNLGAPWLVHTGYNVGLFYAAQVGTYSLLTAIASIGK